MKKYEKPSMELLAVAANGTFLCVIPLCARGGIGRGWRRAPCGTG